MAGWVSNGTTNLNTASGGYRIEAANVGVFNATGLALTTNRNISVTFANAGNCQGVALCLFTLTATGASSTYKDVRVSLQQIMGAVTTSAALDEVTFTSHGFADGQEVEFSATGGGITVNTKYFARVTGSSVPANTFFLYGTYAQALAGGAPGLVNITGAVTPTLYAIRADKTLTGDQIVGGATANAYCSAGYIKDFIFTAPYAVTTSAGVWRFNIIQVGAQTNNWTLRTSDATNPFYITWCDTAATFSSGSDWIYCKDVVTMTASASVTGSGNLGTGDTTQSVCAVIGVGAAGLTPALVSNFLVPNAGTPLTLTINGGFVISGHGGVKIGDSATRWTAANPLTISIVSATSGTAANTGFTDCARRVGTEDARKGTLLIYGEYPAVADAILSANASTGAGSVTTTTNTGWVSGDTFFLGGCNVAGVGEFTTYTVSSTSGATVNFSPNIATYNRVAPGRLIRTNGYGVILNGPSSTVKSDMLLRNFSSLVWSGVKVTNAGIGTNSGLDAFSYDDSANTTITTFEHIFYEATAAATRQFLAGIANFRPSDKGLYIDNCNVAKGVGLPITTNIAPISGVSRTTTYSNNIQLSSNFYSNAQGLANAIPEAMITGNVFENSNLGNIQISAANCVVSNNVFYRHTGTTTGAAFYVNSASNLTGSGNTFNACALSIYLNGTILNSILTDNVFGNIAANTTDVDMAAASYINFELASPTGNVVVSTTNLPSTTEGTHLRISDYNDTPNDDRGWLTYGYYQRTGDGLADTVTRTSGTGKFAFRFQPTDGLNELKFVQRVPTGNIQNLTMVVSLWVYINNTAYDAGTYTMPTLRVRYDNATESTGVALTTFGSWQRLAVVFTPLTTFGEIVVTIEAATDATTTNAYVYWDDWSISFPPSALVDLSGMDLWANAVPVTPSITIFGSPNIWDELVDNHTLPGTFGQMLQPANYGTIQSATSSTVVLEATASSINDFYNGMTLIITENTGKNQARIIQDYVGSTKTATLHESWTTTPDSTSQYVIQFVPDFAHAVWDESAVDNFTTDDTFGKYVKDMRKRKP